MQIRYIVGYVQVKRVSRQTSQGPNKYFRNPNREFPSEPVSYAPTHCPQSVQNYQDKPVKLFCIPCTHKSLA